jgi:hypothetical protein
LVQDPDGLEPLHPKFCVWLQNFWDGSIPNKEICRKIRDDLILEKKAEKSALLALEKVSFVVLTLQ